MVRIAQDNTFEVLVSVALVSVIGFALLFAMQSTATSLYASGGSGQQHDVAVSLDGTNYVPVPPDDGRGVDQTVRDSRGYGMAFAGTDDSYLEADAEFKIANDTTWTVTQPVLAMNDTSQTQVLVAAGDPELVLLYLNNSSGTDQWSAVYLGTTDTWQVNVSAPSPGSTTHLYVTRSASNMTIYRNSTQGESTNLSTAGGPTTNVSAASNCHCVLDETRTFDDELNTSQKTALRTQPVAPLSNATRTGRIMYDAGSGTAVAIYWAPVDATASNVTYVNGFAGHVLEEKTSDLDLSGANDYRWRKDGPQLKPESGGRIDGAPVAFVDYELRFTAAFELNEGVESFYSMLTVAFIAILLGLAVVQFQGIDLR